MTRLFAAIAAIVIAGALATGAVYLVGAIAPFMLQHERHIGFLGPAFGGIGAIAAGIVAARKRRPSH